MIRPTRSYVLAVSALSLGLAAGSAASADRPDRGDRRGPPQEAIDACADASSASACTFVSPHGDDLTGECVEHREGLVCVPEGHEDRRGGRESRERDRDEPNA